GRDQGPFHGPVRGRHRLWGPDDVSWRGELGHLFAGRGRFSVVVAAALYSAYVRAQSAGNSWRDGDSNRERLCFNPERRRCRIGRLATRIYHRDRIRTRRVVVERG